MGYSNHLILPAQVFREGIWEVQVGRHGRLESLDLRLAIREASLKAWEPCANCLAQMVAVGPHGLRGRELLALPRMTVSQLFEW